MYLCLQIVNEMKKLLVILLCVLAYAQVDAQSRPSPSSKASTAKTTKEAPRKTYAERVADSIAGKYGPENVLITNVVTVESSVSNVTATDITIEKTVITNVVIENVICEFLTLTNATITDLKIRNCKIDDFLIENSSVSTLTIEDSSVGAFESDESTIRRQIFMAKEVVDEEPVKPGTRTTAYKTSTSTQNKQTTSSNNSNNNKKKGQIRR